MAERDLTLALACLDMAGTTVTDGGIVEHAFLAALRAVGIPGDDPGNPERLAHVRRTMGMAKIEVFRGLLDHEEQAQRALAAFEEDVDTQVSAGAVAPVPGAEACFEALRSRGLRVCLTTGFTGDTQRRIIDHLGWHRAVDLVLAPGDGVRGRPYPDLVLTAVLRLQVDDVAQVLVAGDTANDLLAGTRAGARLVVGVRTGAHGDDDFATVPHTHVVDSVADLPALVDG